MHTASMAMRDFILERFERYAERVFLYSEIDGRELTYGNVAEMTSRAQQVFERARLERGDYAIVALRNSPELIALFFAALASGVRLVPLGPNYTLEELLAVHHELPLRGVFVDSDNLPRASEVVLPPELACFSIGRGCFDGGHARPAVADVHELSNSHDVAYIMSSSGSTGKPKRICISGANMVAELESMVRAHGLTEHDRHFCVLPLYHASGLFRNILMPFHQGASTVLCEAFDARRFWHLIEAHRIGFVQVVPSILALLLNHEQGPSAVVKEHLRYIGSASGPLSPQLLARFEKRFGIRIVQAYGLTETTCGITLSDTTTGTRRIGSVGRPLDVNEVRIADEHGNALPARAEGEVVVRGANVMEGYLGAEGTPVTPYSDGWFHTNDLGYVDEEGYVYLTGRKSDIVNRGAHKISPVEVEDVFRRHPRVRDVLVVAVPHELLGEDLWACVVPVGDMNGTELLHFVAKHLPSYKVPSSVQFVEEIPWSASGKINRKSFAESVRTAARRLGDDSSAQRAGSEGAAVLGTEARSRPSSLEAELVRIVAEAFNAEPGAIDLKMGPGDLPQWDSMGHIRLLLAVEDAFGVSFSPADSTAVQTVSDLLALLSGLLAGGARKTD